MNLLRRMSFFWRCTAAMTFSFAFLTVGIMQGARQLDVPGCVTFRDDSGRMRGEFDLTSGRYVSFAEPESYGLSAWLSPDGDFYIYSQQDSPNAQSYTIYLQPLQGEPTPIALQQGVFGGAGGTTLFVNNRVGWPDERTAFLWMGLDRKTYLTVVNRDGNNRHSSVFEPFDSKTLVALVTIHSWSGDGAYLSIDEGIPSTYKDARRYTFWSTDELRRISTILDERPVQLGVWSPQGHTIAAITGSRTEPKELVILSPGAESEPIIVPLPNLTYVHIDWSPDGRYFVLSSPLLVDIGVTSDHWQFDLYSRDGELVYGGLVGTMLNNGTGLPSLYAKWSPDSRLWVYLLDRRQSHLDLVGLDMSTGMHKVIASNLATGLARDVFHMPWRRNGSISVDANTVFVPDGNRILISKWRDEKVTLEIADLDGSNRVLLVENAEYIYYPQNSPLGGAGWSPDGSEVKVLWSSGSDMRLTMAKTDGSDVYTLADDIDEIAYPRDVIFTRFGLRWLGFITRRDNGYGVEVYDRETHTHYRLVSGLTAASDSWSLSPNSDQTYAAITVGQVAARQTNRLFLAPLNGQQAREIHPDIIGAPVWSLDGQQLIYTYRIQPRIYAVERVALDGTLLGSRLVQARVGTTSHLWAWNGCE